LSKEDISLINNVGYINYVPIKKGISFAPFILIGLFISIFLGNTYELILMIGGIICG
jgi:prepilin signal peptidase PulO-like enzyme (type II secretory pathway)